MIWWNMLTQAHRTWRLWTLADRTQISQRYFQNVLSKLKSGIMCLHCVSTLAPMFLYSSSSRLLSLCYAAFTDRLKANKSRYQENGTFFTASVIRDFCFWFSEISKKKKYKNAWNRKQSQTARTQLQFKLHLSNILWLCYVKNINSTYLAFSYPLQDISSSSTLPPAVNLLLYQL